MSSQTDASYTAMDAPPPSPLPTHSFILQEEPLPGTGLYHAHSVMAARQILPPYSWQGSQQERLLPFSSGVSFQESLRTHTEALTAACQSLAGTQGFIHWKRRFLADCSTGKKRNHRKLLSQMQIISRCGLGSFFFLILHKLPANSLFFFQDFFFSFYIFFITLVIVTIMFARCNFAKTIIVKKTKKKHLTAPCEYTNNGICITASPLRFFNIY